MVCFGRHFLLWWGIRCNVGFSTPGADSLLARRVIASFEHDTHGWMVDLNPKLIALVRRGSGHEREGSYALVHGLERVIVRNIFTLFYAHQDRYMPDWV